MSDDKPKRVVFTMSPAMAAEVARILKCTDLGKPPELFRRAFTLLRIHVDAAQQGHRVYIQDPARPDERDVITLPFHCNGPERDSR
jgi:hypothetical protein